MLIAVDAGGRTVLKVRRNRHGVAVVADRDRKAELVGGAGIGRLEIGLLFPGTIRREPEDIGGACVAHGIVLLLAVDAGCGAVFHSRAHRQRFAIAAERHRHPQQHGAAAELIVNAWTGSLDIGR